MVQNRLKSRKSGGERRGVYSGPKTKDNKYGIYAPKRPGKAGYQGGAQLGPYTKPRTTQQRWKDPAPKPGQPQPMKQPLPYKPTAPATVPFKLAPLKLPPLKQKSFIPRVPLRPFIKFTPWGRIYDAVSLGFELLDTWMQTQEEIPEGYDFGPAAVQCCHTVHQNTAYLSITANSNVCDHPIECGTNGQVPSGSDASGWTYGDDLAVPGNRYIHVWFGNRTGSLAVRMQCREKWWIDRGAIGPYPNSIPFVDPIPAVVQPMPASLTPPPAVPYPDVWSTPPQASAPPIRPPDGYPKPTADPWPDRKPRPKPGQAPAPAGVYKPYHREEVGPAPATETKPKPATDTPVMTMPRVKEQKWKITDPAIAKYYGWLTEISDALDCFEKVLKTRRGGPLHERTMRMATRLTKGMTPKQVADLMKCLFWNQVEDYVIGKANSVANKALTKSEYYRSPAGLGRGQFTARMR